MAGSGRESTLSLIIKAVDNATAPLKSVQDKITGLGAPISSLSSSFANLGQAAGIQQLGGAIRGVASEVIALGQKVYATVLGMAKSSAEAARTAETVGVKLTFLKEVGYAASRAGISTDEFSSALQSLNNSVGKATLGHGRLYKLLAEAAPAVAVQLKGAKSTEEAFNLVSGAISMLPDSMRRATLAQAAFGGSGAKMVGLLKGGPEAIDALRVQFQRLTGSTGNEASAQAGAKMSQTLVNTVQDAEIAWGAMKNAAFKELIPSFVTLAKQVETFFVANRGPIQGWAKNFGKDLPAKVGLFVDKVKEIAGTASGVLKAIGGFRTVFLALSAAIFGPVISSLVALGVAVLTNPIGLIATAIGLAAVVIVKYWGPISGFFKSVWSAVTTATSAAWEWIKDACGSAWNWIKDTASAIWTPISEFFVGVWVIIKETFRPALEWISDLCSTVWSGIKEAAVAIWTPISAFFSTIWDGIKAAAGYAWDWIKTTLGWTPVGLIVSNWQPIKTFFSGLWDSVVGVFEEAWAKVEPIIDAVSKGAALVKSVVGKVLSGPGFSTERAQASADAVGDIRSVGRANLDAEGARPIDLAAIMAKQAKASLKVSFDNMPKGVKVERDSDDGGDDMDIDRGYANLT